MKDKASLGSLRDWVDREYWPNPEGFQPDPVRRIDVARYASALADGRDWGAGGPGNATPPGLMEIASPNYLSYYELSGEDFLRRLLPFDSPWGLDWTPMMLVRRERWEVERAVAIGDVIHGTSTITDVSWEEAREKRPEMLAIEFTKVYRDAEDGLLGRVIWDMVFVEHALIDAHPDAPEEPARPDEPRRREGATPRLGDSAGSYTRVFDMEALVRWSAAIWDLGLPHVDPDYARRVYGLPHAVAHGPFINASLARVVTDWMDAGDRVLTHSGRFRRPVVANDRLLFSGAVAAVRDEASGPVAEIEARATNQYGEVVAESRTVCALAG